MESNGEHRQIDSEASDTQHEMYQRTRTHCKKKAKTSKIEEQKKPPQQKQLWNNTHLARLNER